MYRLQYYRAQNCLKIAQINGEAALRLQVSAWHCLPAVAAWENGPLAAEAEQPGHWRPGFKLTVKQTLQIHLPVPVQANASLIRVMHWPATQSGLSSDTVQWAIE